MTVNVGFNKRESFSLKGFEILESVEALEDFEIIRVLDVLKAKKVVYVWWS